MTPPEQSDYQSNQTRVINAFLQYHPELAEAIAIASSVIERITFPVNSFQDLIEAMGGAEAKVQFRERSFIIAEFESQVPAYYFPIANENDFIAKIGDLARRPPPIATPGSTLVAATASAPSVPPPSMSTDEIRSHIPLGVAGVGGIQR